MTYAPFVSGLAGSLALTALHETLRKNVVNAPRMDLMGEQGLVKILHAADIKVPDEPELFDITMAGDLLGNAGYYAMVGSTPRHPVVAGAILGFTAGLGALKLPAKMGLNEEFSNKTHKTQLLTMAIYVVGGLVAGAVYNILRDKTEPAPTQNDFKRL